MIAAVVSSKLQVVRIVSREYIVLSILSIDRSSSRSSSSSSSSNNNSSSSNRRCRPPL